VVDVSVAVIELSVSGFNDGVDDIFTPEAGEDVADIVGIIVLVGELGVEGPVSVGASVVDKLVGVLIVPSLVEVGGISLVATDLVSLVELPGGTIKVADVCTVDVAVIGPGTVTINGVCDVVCVCKGVIGSSPRVEVMVIVINEVQVDVGTLLLNSALPGDSPPRLPSRQPPRECRIDPTPNEH
jgi:hypothetical protein